MKIQFKIIIILALACVFSCEDFVDVEAPNFQIISENVFGNDKTATAAINGIYNELMRASFSSGGSQSITVLGDMSADIIKPIDITHTRYGPFWQNEISTLDSPDADANLSLWNSAYNIIYLTNSALEGLEKSNNITESLKDDLMGQALFIRAFCYFYLTNLYNDVPLILTTEYNINALASRNTSEDVWKQVSKDLDRSITFLNGVTNYINEERTNINLYVAKAFRARVYLFQKNWVKAEELSTQVIDQSDMYNILEDLNLVFLANSKEAIWQISPAGIEGLRITWEAQVFIRFVYLPGIVFGDIECTDSFITSFENNDKRFINWIGQEKNEKEETIRYYSYKYKHRSSPDQGIPEYSMVMRLAEQFLIRAEARAMQNKLPGAIADLDKVRKRAGIELISETNPTINKKELINIIMNERKKELFTEWGHRWLDIKRKGSASNVLSPIKPLWQSTDVWYPIPGEERMKNSNLSQNMGY